ncbi:MAG TPA: hypothetical protein VNO70_17840 [Blastocatellia bacterium]|nr:hypothetical protein [Blastocatellia bacterium]
MANKQLTEDQIKAREKLEKLVKEQGAKPVTIEELNAMGDLWPEDEDVDEFLAAREEWRRESRDRDLP